eukprot:4374552-Amphidinium_carterae.1
MSLQQLGDGMSMHSLKLLVYIPLNKVNEDCQPLHTHEATLADHGVRTAREVLFQVIAKGICSYHQPALRETGCSQETRSN